MNKCKRVVVPRQPFLVFATTKYYKVNVMQYGISHFYKFHANSDLIDVAEVIPDGSVDIMFRCGTGKPEALCYGTRLHTRKINETMIVEKGDIIFGVRFFPGNVMFLKSCSAYDLIENAVDLTLINNKKQMIEQICTCQDFNSQIRIFMKEYMYDYGKTKSQILQDKKLQMYMLQRMIDSGGSVRVHELSEEVVFSVRHLNQIFHDEYGMSPKEFEKMIRFQNVLTELQGDSKIADIATDAGYYDQSHLLKEFKQIIGISPKKYLEKLHELNVYTKVVDLTQHGLQSEC